MHTRWKGWKLNDLRGNDHSGATTGTHEAGRTPCPPVAGRTGGPSRDRAMTVAVVTGAARGMGRECVKRLKGLTEHLVAVDLDVPEIEGTISLSCDVSDPAAIDALVRQVRALGPFRALAHAAGISPTMADSRRIFDVDLVGTQRLLDAFGPLVVPGSAAVCFSSLAAYQIAPFADPALDALLDEPLVPDFLDRIAGLVTDSGYAYGLAKRGVLRAAARAAVQWGPGGGRVNSLAPGIIDTPMGRQELEHQPVMRTMLESVPLGRLGEAAEVAAVAAFLLSDDASFVSGIDVLVDGAILAGMASPHPADTL
jgi:NAD(P)-dependent dehydrogenase (short-subunit alcohol dehydrogenase family)